MQDVEESVEAQEKHDMCCYVLYILKFCYHIELGQDSEGFEPDRKGPKNAIYGKAAMEEEAKDSRYNIQVVVRKRIRLAIIALLMNYCLRVCRVS